MLGTIARGTKEEILVDVTDALSSVTDLTGSTCTFDVKQLDGTAVVTAASATGGPGMKISLILDTTGGGFATISEYNLYVNFTVGAGQNIRKGPYYFRLA